MCKVNSRSLVTEISKLLPILVNKAATFDSGLCPKAQMLFFVIRLHQGLTNKILLACMHKATFCMALEARRKMSLSPLDYG